jgi:hypothetical protein
VPFTQNEPVVIFGMIDAQSVPVETGQNIRYREAATQVRAVRPVDHAHGMGAERAGDCFQFSNRSRHPCSLPDTMQLSGEVPPPGERGAPNRSPSGAC